MTAVAAVDDDADLLRQLELDLDNIILTDDEDGEPPMSVTSLPCIAQGSPEGSQRALGAVFLKVLG